MGNDDSQVQNHDYLPISPVIEKLRQSFRLTLKINLTSCFINQNLARSLQKNAGSISRTQNPFCALELASDLKSKMHQQIQNWIDCVLISPIMLIACPKSILKNNQKLFNHAKLNGRGLKGKAIFVSIIKMFVLDQTMSAALLVLEQPVVQLGWVGLTFIEKTQDIANEPFKVLYHPKRMLKETTAGQFYDYQQEVHKSSFKPLKNYYGEGKNKVGSLIVKIIDKKPYLIGVQNSQKQAFFFSKESIQQIINLAKNYLDSDKEKEYFQQIDIQGFQLMQKL